MTALSPQTIYPTSDGEPVAEAPAHLYALLITQTTLGTRSLCLAPASLEPLNQA